MVSSSVVQKYKEFLVDLVKDNDYEVTSYSDKAVTIKYKSNPTDKGYTIQFQIYYTLFNRFFITHKSENITLVDKFIFLCRGIDRELYDMYKIIRNRITDDVDNKVIGSIPNLYTRKEKLNTFLDGNK